MLKILLVIIVMGNFTSTKHGYIKHNGQIIIDNYLLSLQGVYCMAILYNSSFLSAFNKLCYVVDQIKPGTIVQHESEISYIVFKNLTTTQIVFYAKNTEENDTFLYHLTKNVIHLETMIDKCYMNYIRCFNISYINESVMEILNLRHYNIISEYNLIRFTRFLFHDYCHNCRSFLCSLYKILDVKYSIMYVDNQIIIDDLNNIRSLIRTIKYNIIIEQNEKTIRDKYFN